MTTGRGDMPRKMGRPKGGKTRAPIASPVSPIADYQERARRAFSVPRLDLDTALIIDAALSTGQSPREIAVHLGIPIATVEDTLLTAILHIGRVLDIAAAGATISLDA